MCGSREGSPLTEHAQTGVFYMFATSPCPSSQTRRICLSGHFFVFRATWPSFLSSHHYSHFDVMRRVSPSSLCRYSRFNVMRRVSPSSLCRYSPFNMMRRVCPSSPCRYSYFDVPLLFILLPHFDTVGTAPLL